MAKRVMNKFENDGSFLEMFKKMEGKKQTEEEKQNESEPSHSSVNETSSSAKNPLPCVGKRRGGKILPTGMVKKVKKDTNEDRRKDVWSQYMSEVRKYKARSCTEEDQTRPLVK